MPRGESIREDGGIHVSSEHRPEMVDWVTEVIHVDPNDPFKKYKRYEVSKDLGFACSAGDWKHEPSAIIGTVIQLFGEHVRSECDAPHPHLMRVYNARVAKFSKKSKVVKL